ncbi:TM2 domain-containing protein [uncultured Sphingomonas sp.]|uniref:TM2 domain-containing protein n=1 Tax=uncultured Sphingomonas sp. TaxID=158754 RepID=UPI0025CCACF6|nr:TM2 domain-containing protein [uncultured Sphingomonas sp.]
MRGQVLGVDRTSGEGQISGEDGSRYVFTQEDWSDSRHPAVGVKVDFDVDGRRARRIFRLLDGQQVAAPVGEPRNKILAVVLALFFGSLGIHRFYLGRTGSGVVMLLLSLTIVGLLVTGIWAFVDAVRYLLMSDAEFAYRYPRR